MGRLHCKHNIVSRGTSLSRQPVTTSEIGITYVIERKLTDTGGFYICHSNLVITLIENLK